jgi:selenium metabolism protein YedF
MGELRVDARGLDCPQPVIKTREALGQPGVLQVTVLVDEMSNVDNVMAMARNEGWDGKITRQEAAHIELELSRASRPLESTETSAAQDSCAIKEKIVALIASDRFGQGDDELGGILMRAFIKTLWEVAPRPQTMIFINSGVKLTTLGSELLADISKLADGGVEILSCGTCLDFYQLKDKLEVGKVSNMFEIASRLAGADTVVRP